MSAPDTVLIVLKRSRISFLRFAPYGPVVTINGRTEILPWGEHRLTIPDAQPLSIDVCVKGREPGWRQGTFGGCGVVVPPGTVRVVEYSAPAQEFCKGDVGPLGTTRFRGTVAQALIVGALGLFCVLMVLGILGIGLAALSGELSGQQLGSR